MRGRYLAPRTPRGSTAANLFLPILAAAAILSTGCTATFMRGLLQRTAAPPPSPCTWTRNTCEPSPDFTIYIGDLKNLSLAERSTQREVAMAAVCGAAASKKGCLALERRGCIWMETSSPYEEDVCVLDRSYIAVPLTCPGSTARNVEHCSLKRTNESCSKDTRCVWRDDFFEAQMGDGDSASKRDVCVHSAASNMSFAEYVKWVTTNAGAANSSMYFNWYGRCEVTINTLKASKLLTPCLGFSLQSKPACSTNCTAVVKRTEARCLAAGCAWDSRLVPTWGSGGPSPCSLNQSKYYDLFFGPRVRGPIRQQYVQCYGPVAGKSQRSCNRYRLQ